MNQQRMSAEKAEEPSKQFQPKKFKETGQNWLKEQPEASSFTPFKSNTLNYKNDAASHNGTLRSTTRTNPFVFEHPPASHSTPKAMHVQQPARPGSAMQMNKHQKLTWGRLPSNAAPRSASAMDHAFTLRPSSRQSEVAGIAPMANCVGSRYQSYCTLPRPEQLDTESLMGMHTQRFYGNPQPPPQMLSRPPSAMAIPGMASDFMRTPVVYPTMTPAMPYAAPKQLEVDIINWNTLSTYGSMQVLFALCIFGFGVARHLKEAKWAVGAELIYSISVLITAFAGIYAVRMRKHSVAVFSHVLNVINIVLATVPFVLGLFPTIPWSFPEAPATWFVSEHEPIELDFCLSLVIFLQVIVSFIIAISGCKSMGLLCSTTEGLKLQREMHKAFEGSPLPPKV